MRFVVWLWRGNRDYCAAHVNLLQRQLERVAPGEASLVCVTDDTKGFAPGIEVVKIPAEAAELAKYRTPERANFPSCYPRLWCLSKGAKILGDRFMVIDVDLVFTASPRPLWAWTEDFVGWRPLRTWGRESRIGGGIYLHTPGTRTHVWDNFVKDPARAIAKASAAGLRGSDQAWLSYCLADKEVVWPRMCGIYSVRDLTRGAAELRTMNVLDEAPPSPSPIPRNAHLMNRSARMRAMCVTPSSATAGLPKDALIVQFNGPDKPWQPGTQQRHGWLQRHCA